MLRLKLNSDLAEKCVVREINKAFYHKKALCFICFFIIPIIAKVGGLQSQGTKGEAVVNLLRVLGNAGAGVLRLLQRYGKLN